MSIEFTTDGVSADTFQDVFDELVTGFQTIYGNEINLDPDTPDGQRIALLTQKIHDIQDFGIWLYNQSDPDTATGDSLIRQLKLSGIYLLTGDYSQAQLTVIASKSCILPINWTVQDTLGQNWVTLYEYALTAGSNSVTVFSEVEGAIEAAIGTITTPVTIIIGVSSVSNPAIAITGRAEETEEEIRIRRNKSLESSATSTVGGLYSALGLVYNVSDINIIENETNTYDSTNALDAHSIWIILTGGDSGDIAEAIAKNISAGCGLKGSETGLYTEEIILPDGSILDYIHEEKFDYSSANDLHVRLNATKTNPLVSVDEDGIKTALVAESFRIGENAQAGKLYATCYGAGNTAIIHDLEISTDGATWTDEIKTQDSDKYFTISIGNIAITVT